MSVVPPNEVAVERSLLDNPAVLRTIGVIGFPIFIGIAAQVSFPLPPWDLPFSLQSLAVVLSALCLGRKYGSLALLIYIAAGAIGFPVFSQGRDGLEVVLGQTGGYILGFLIAQPVIVGFIRRSDGSIRGWGAMITAVLAGHGVIFLIGLPWLYFWRLWFAEQPPTIWLTFRNGMLAFIPGMIIKAAIAVWLGRLAAPLASKKIW